MKIDTLERFVDPPFVIERGEKSDVLVIGFAGFGGWLAMNPSYFYSVTPLWRCSRVMLRDLARTCYFGGLPVLAPSFEELVDLLQRAIDMVSPKITIAIGTSGGATAALLYGHALKVDYVHAFSPFTNFARDFLDRHGDVTLRPTYLRTLDKVGQLKGTVPKLVDLQKVLVRDNGTTQYFVHFCRGRRFDAANAAHIEGCPNVKVFGYPCAKHQVAEVLARRELLTKILNPRLQANLPRVIETEARRVMAERTRGHTKKLKQEGSA